MAFLRNAYLLINYGDFLYGLFMVKIELLLQFAMCIMWVSAALAYDFDLGGYENCQCESVLSRM